MITSEQFSLKAIAERVEEMGWSLVTDETLPPRHQERTVAIGSVNISYLDWSGSSREDYSLEAKIPGQGLWKIHFNKSGDDGLEITRATYGVGKDRHIRQDGNWMGTDNLGDPNVIAAYFLGS